MNSSMVTSSSSSSVNTGLDYEQQMSQRVSTIQLGSRAPAIVTNKDGSISIEIDANNDNSGFYVRWENLTLTINPAWHEFKAQPKRILQSLNGYFLSGELVALMGPSGAGKTTLLNCLSLKHGSNLTGDIWVVGKPKVRMAIVPQHDDFLPQFTVTETIFYASRYKNRTHEISHRAVVRRVIKQLGLDLCKDNWVTRCSGGQQKRVAIAQELVKRPNILILDEPTSGLDSSCCHQTIMVLRRILDQASTAGSAMHNPMCIITTIHQPSAKVMSLFDRVYMMAPGGRLVYNGRPQDIVKLCGSVQAPCPPFYNPMDHFLDVVSGDYGRNKVDKLIRQEKKKKIAIDKQLEAVSGQTLKKATLYDPCPITQHLWIHYQRSTIQMLRDPILFALRFSLHLFMPFFFAYLWGTDIGKGSACPSFNLQSISSISTITSMNLTRAEHQDMDWVNDNFVYLFYIAMFSMYAAVMITVLTFPLDVTVLAKEYFNGWYEVPTYITGKILADFPFQTACIAIFSSISWYMTHQPESLYEWRYLSFMYSMAMLSFISQTQGLIIGAVFMRNLSASVFVGPLTLIPIVVFSGFGKRYNRLYEWLQPIVKGSYFHYSLKIVLSAVWGWQRCECDPAKYQFQMDYIEYEDIQTIGQRQKLPDIDVPGVDLTNTGKAAAYDLRNEQTAEANKDIWIGQFKCDDDFQSLITHEYDVQDQDLYIGMAILAIFLIVMRLFVLLLVMFRVRRG